MYLLSSHYVPDSVLGWNRKMAKSQAVRLGAAARWGQGKHACTGASVSERAEGDRPDRGVGMYVLTRQWQIEKGTTGLPGKSLRYFKCHVSKPELLPSTPDPDIFSSAVISLPDLSNPMLSQVKALKVIFDASFSHSPPVISPDLFSPPPGLLPSGNNCFTCNPDYYKGLGGGYGQFCM